MVHLIAPSGRSEVGGGLSIFGPPELWLRESLALAVTAFIFGAIAVILWQRGPRVVTCSLVYVASLVSTQLLISRLSSPPFSFRYSSFVSSVHFLGVWLACIFYWAYKGDVGKSSPFAMLQSRRMIETITPVAISAPLTVIFNNKALLYVGPSVCAIIGTLSPVTVAVLSRFFGRRHPTLAWVGVSVAFMGALLVVKGELTAIQGQNLGKSTAAAAGVCLALASVCTRCIKIVVLDFAISPADYRPERTPLTPDVNKEAIGPMTVYAAQAPWCFFTTAVFTLCTENVGEAVAGMQSVPILEIILLSSFSAILLNLAGILALRDLGGTSQQIIGKLNTICISALSMGFLGETLPRPVVFGGCLVLFGVAIFERGVALEADAKSASPKVGKTGGATALLRKAHDAATVVKV